MLDGKHRTQREVAHVHGGTVRRLWGAQVLPGGEWRSMAISRTDINRPVTNSFSLMLAVGYSRSVSRDRRWWGGRAERVVHGPSSASQVGTPVGHRGSCGGVGEPCDCGERGEDDFQRGSSAWHCLPPDRIHYGETCGTALPMTECITGKTRKQ